MSKPATTIDLAAFKQKLADSLERNAKSAGLTIARESVTCELATGLQIVTATIKREESPTEKEITAGVDMFYAYVSIDSQRELPAGHYRIRLALPGYEKKGDVKVSFIDEKGKVVHSLTGKGGPRSLKSGTTTNVTAFRADYCGRKKCLRICRNGFLDWDWACVDRNGNVINCLDPQP